LIESPSAIAQLGLLPANHLHFPVPLWRIPFPMKIESIEISHHRLPLDPPFHASWDGRARTHFEAALIRVRTDEGHEGHGSGDAMVGFEGYEDLFLGKDPNDLERHNAVLANLAFHRGRCWPLDLALWDLVGKIEKQPAWKMLGGRSNRVRAYASSGVLRDANAMADAADRFLEEGFPAMKIRFRRGDWRDDIRALEAVRSRVGNRLELMVDCNQGWRMPWDAEPPWTFDDALPVARELERLEIRDNTVIMLWSDHGFHLGTHGMWGKRTNYEEATRSPLLLSIPGMKTAGRRTRALVEFVDLFPTLADIAGLPIPEHIEGTSFLPLIHAPDQPWKTGAFSLVHRNDPGGSGVAYRGYALRTERYRYVEWWEMRKNRKIRRDARELYDLTRDPSETVNIVYTSESAALVIALADQLWAGYDAATPNLATDRSHNRGAAE